MLLPSPKFPPSVASANEYTAFSVSGLILPEFEPSLWPVHIVHREGHHAAARTRVFIDLLAERLRQDKVLN